MKQINKRQLKDMINIKDDITNVDTSAITDMYRMLVNETDFNQDIGDWDVSNVNDMFSMFNNAICFNQDISDWDVRNVMDIRYMFQGAEAFINGEYFMKTMLNWGKQLNITTGELIDIVLGELNKQGVIK